MFESYNMNFMCICLELMIDLITIYIEIAH